VSRAYTKAPPACTNECCKHGLPNWTHVTLRLSAVTWGLSAAPAGPARPLAAPQPRSCSRTASQPILDSPRQLQERGRPAGPSSSTPWCATAYAAAGALVGCVPSAGDGRTRCHGQTVQRGGGMADLLRSAKSPILPNHRTSDHLDWTHLSFGYTGTSAETPRQVWRPGYGLYWAAIAATKWFALLWDR
jgi:hypothetical protein